MTDRIDLDELTDARADEETQANPGDWIWRDGEAPPPAEAGGGDSGGTEREAVPAAGREEDGGVDGGPSSEPGGRRPSTATPHVPRPNAGKPVGVPVEGGGAGGGTGPTGSSAASTEAGTGSTPAAADDASGPHGGDADDMTLAFTLDAIRRFPDPAAVLADAGRWADWIGIVGDVDAHVINKFQRDHRLDVDFFNGTGTTPAERLADVGPTSMFYAERHVLVGLPPADAAIADEADWEFVPLETAAANADWPLE